MDISIEIGIATLRLRCGTHRNVSSLEDEEFGFWFEIVKYTEPDGTTPWKRKSGSTPRTFMLDAEKGWLEIAPGSHFLPSQIFEMNREEALRFFAEKCPLPHVSSSRPPDG